MWREMTKFVIDDYRAGVLKLDDDKELREKSEPPDVRKKPIVCPGTQNI